MDQKQLTEEQKRIIEEKRKKALALREKRRQAELNVNSNADRAKTTSQNPPTAALAQGIRGNGPVSNVSGSSSYVASAQTGHTANKNCSLSHENRKCDQMKKLSNGPSSSGSVSHSSSGSFYNSNKATGQPSPAFSRSAPYAPVAQNPVQRNPPVAKGNTLTSAQQRQGLYTSSQALQMILNSPSKKAERKKKAKVCGKCVLHSRTRFDAQIGYHPAVVEIFKTMTTKSYDSNTRQWSFDLKDYETLMRQLLAIDDVFIEPLPKYVVQCFKTRIEGKEEPPVQVPEADLSLVDQKLVSSLMTFQRHGVNFGIWKNGRVLIADDMGLGKTIQAICLACYYQQEWPMLVVVPSSVRFAWREQFLRWNSSLDPQSINVVVSGKDNCTSGKVNIVSYDLMTRYQKILLEKRFKVVIMDESHSLKNFKTARTKAAGPLLKEAKRVILLSGTPALSRPSELFPQIASVNPRLFPNFREFGIRYCDGKEMPWGWDFSGSSNLEELQILLEEHIMIRRLKKDVLSELPSKRREMVILDPSSVKVDKSMATSHKLVDKLKGMDRRGALLEYFHSTGNAKIKAVKEYVLDLLENDHKFLLFAHHQEMLDAIEEAVYRKYKYIRIDGRTAPEQRQEFCDSFQSTKEVKVAILSITAANAGINLTAASLVIFAELFWNPGILVQAEDRVHRLGQENSVLIQYLVGTGTADDYIWPMVQRKLEILGKAGLSKDDFSTADTTALKDPKQKDIMTFFEESFFEDEGSDDALTGDQEKQNEEKGSTSSKPVTSSSFGTPSRKTPKKSRLVPSPGQTTLFKYFTPSKSPDDSPQKDAKEEAKRSLFPVNEMPADEVAAKELADVMKMPADDLFCDFSQDFDDCEPSAPKKAKFS